MCKHCPPARASPSPVAGSHFLSPRPLALSAAHPKCGRCILAKALAALGQWCDEMLHTKQSSCSLAKMSRLCERRLTLECGSADNMTGLHAAHLQATSGHDAVRWQSIISKSDQCLCWRRHFMHRRAAAAAAPGKRDNYCQFVKSPAVATGVCCRWHWAERQLFGRKLRNQRVV